MCAGLIADIFKPYRVKSMQGTKRAVRVPPILRMTRELLDFLGCYTGFVVAWHGGLAYRSVAKL